MSSEAYENKIKKYISILPDSPGVYTYFDSKDDVIYVGKAKNLKKRVSSYFTKKQADHKTKILVKSIYRIEHVVVETEEDALLLENSLIKKLQPRYNVRLKDDKSYPWICVRRESFPRVFSTRNVVRDGSTYFGPYTSMGVVKTILGVIKNLYNLRNCNYNLSKENIAKGNMKVCLEYHIGNCNGPCENHQTEEAYLEDISRIKDIMKGNLNSVTAHLKSLMQEYSLALDFEKAENIKSKLEILERFRSKSTVVSSIITDLDVFAFDEDDSCTYVTFMKVVNGSIIQVHTVEMRKKLNETKEELLSLGIVEIRQKVFSNSKEIVVPFMPDTELKNTKVTIPKRGDKLKLLELSQRNVKYYKLEKLKQRSAKSPQKKTTRIMNAMMLDLRLDKHPTHIECFDNSNMQGSYPVASCVVFRNGKPSKKEYRHFNIKTVEGPNDFASMEEAIYRRYKRLSEEGLPLPQLVIVDGGKGQLSAALNSINRLGLAENINIIAIAKRLEEIFVPGDTIPLYIDKDSETLKIVQHLRNEAHRFGIAFHRGKRSKDFIKSELDEIPGIGNKTKEILLSTFKSIKRIKSLTKDDMAELIGASKAKKIYEYFNNRL